MDSKERVRAAMQHRSPDRAPANFQTVPAAGKKLLEHYGFHDMEQLYQKFDIDMREVSAAYMGPELNTAEIDGNRSIESYWGFRKTAHWTGRQFHMVTSYFPLNDVESVKDIEKHTWPSTKWFDYECIKRQCENHKDKAIIVGQEGVFQNACNLRRMEKLLVDMAVNPEIAHAIFDRMVEFELEHYERILMAADGQIDILRPKDDYGTQANSLFSTDMWREFFMENTKKLVNLAHKYGAFYQQHSCGSIRTIIPELIACGADAIEPLQKVKGLEPEELKREFGDKLTFHGGIDTQALLPFGTPDEVRKETKRYIDTLNVNGGYILMASQHFDLDVPAANIEAMYSVR